jgi:hemoglobin
VSANPTQPETPGSGGSPEAAAAAPAPTPYDLIGGEPAVRRLVERFYYLMDTRPEAAELRAMHARDLGPMTEKLGDFMMGWLGGPRIYFERSDAGCITEAHVPYAIDAAARDQWLACMYQALDDTGVPCEVQALVRQPLARVAEFLKNR